MLVPVLTRPRSNLFRRRRGTAAKRPAESSTSASSCFHSEVISTSCTFLSAFQRSEKRPRIQGDDEARPAGSECSEVIGGARARSNEIELSESSCFGPVLESDLACPEKLADEAVATEYSSACDPLTPVEPEDEVVSGLYSCSDYSLSPLLDLSPLTTDDDDDDEAPSARFSFFLAFAKQFVPCAHPRARAATDPTLDLLQPQGKRFEDLDDEESYETFRRREQHGVRAFDYTHVYSSLPDSYCRLIGEQRVVMVNWIIEHSNVMKLQPATVFMGIGLMDRFLTRGYVKGLRNLQLMGIACITLATRIEENQPYNW